MGKLVREITSVQSPEIDLCWHDVAVRRYDELITGESDTEECDGSDDAEAPRIIAACSVSAGSYSAAGDGAILEAVDSRLGRLAAIRCEVWLTAPCQVPIFNKASQDLTVDPSRVSEIGKGVMEEYGLVLMTKSLGTQEEVYELRSIAQAHICSAEEAVSRKRPDLRLGVDLFAFKEMSSRGGQRFDLLFPDTDAFGAIYRLAAAAPWRPIIEQMLGADVQCEVSVVYSRPGADVQEWHTDGAHLGRTSAWDSDVASSSSQGSSLAYALCVFVPLIDLDRVVGFTQFWPGTHMRSGLIGLGCAAPLLGCVVDGLLPAGGCVVYDYRLMHRGMPNRSATTHRPLLQFFYHVPSYVERKNYGTESLFE